MEFATFAHVRAEVGGIKGVISKLGDAPPEHKWKSFPKCPFCGHKDCAGVFRKGEADWFKCQHTACSSGGRVVAETGYINLREGLSEETPTEGGPSPAYKRLLELAGVYEELESKSEREAHAPSPQPSPVPTEEGEEREAHEAEPRLGTSPRPPSDSAPDSATVGTSGEGTGLTGGRLLTSSPTGETGARLPNPVLSPGAAASLPTGGEPPAQAAGKPPAVQSSAEELPVGLTALRWFYERLLPTSSQMQAYLPDGGPVPDPLPDGLAKKLTFRPVSLLEKRGLTPESCAALGFRANPRTNEKLLLELRAEFDWEETLWSGLWLEGDLKRKMVRRPNNQYCGNGQVGKKPEKDRRDDKDKWQWGWCEPVLIPYFNEAGELIKLRPHKGGASAGTAAGSERIYVPRDYRALRDHRVEMAANTSSPLREGSSERYPTVIICEGEYKAMVIWQMMGGGMALNLDAGDRQEPVGVCALPGISFARNLKMRADMESWLRAVGCQRVIVSFDDEDKSHKPMRQRFDAIIYARYLARDLGLQLRIEARVILKLPEEWRVHGKADWDGGLVRLRQQLEI